MSYGLLISSGCLEPQVSSCRHCALTQSIQTLAVVHSPQEAQEKKKLFKQNFIELPNTAQPNAMDTMRPARGTVLKSNNVQKRGQPNDLGGTYERMNKPQFQKLAVDLCQQPHPKLLTKEQLEAKKNGSMSNQTSKTTVSYQNSTGSLPKISEKPQSQSSGSRLGPPSAQASQEEVKLPPVKA